MEDIDHAIVNLKKNLSAVLNCLTVIIGKLHSRQQVSQCQSADFAPLLAELHQLQQPLLTMISQDEIPGPRGPAGAAGIIGAPGAAGPSASDPYLSCETDTDLTCGQFSPGILQTAANDRKGNIVATPAATKHSQLGQLFGVSNDTVSVPVGQPL